MLQVTVRSFKPNDIPELIHLFRDTIHRVCQKDYDALQLKAWAPDFIDEKIWLQRFTNSWTIVALIDEQVVGFTNLETDGNVDMLYVHADHQQKKIASTLFKLVEARALELELTQLKSDVSITAKPFFLHSGFRVLKEHTKEVRGATFINSLMIKDLNF